MINISLWLSDPNRTYQEGLQLLQKLKPKEYPFYASVLNPDPGSYHFRMLVSLLRNEERKLIQARSIPPSYLKHDPPVIAVTKLDLTDSKKTTSKKAETTTGLVIVSNPVVDFKELPPALQEVYLQNKSFTPQIARKHVELKAANTDAQRKSLLEDITSMESQRAANWKTLDNWWSKHKMDSDKAESFDNEKEIAAQAVRKVKRIETLKINISRATKELKTMTGKKADSRKSKLVLWNKELSDLEKQ